MQQQRQQQQQTLEQQQALGDSSTQAVPSSALAAFQDHDARAAGTGLLEAALDQLQSDSDDESGAGSDRDVDGRSAGPANHHRPPGTSSESQRDASEIKHDDRGARKRCAAHLDRDQRPGKRKQQPGDLPKDEEKLFLKRFEAICTPGMKRNPPVDGPKHGAFVEAECYFDHKTGDPDHLSYGTPYKQRGFKKKAKRASEKPPPEFGRRMLSLWAGPFLWDERHLVSVEPASTIPLRIWLHFETETGSRYFKTRQAQEPHVVMKPCSEARRERPLPDALALSAEGSDARALGVVIEEPRTHDGAGPLVLRLNQAVHGRDRKLMEQTRRYPHDVLAHLRYIEHSASLPRSTARAAVAREHQINEAQKRLDRALRVAPKSESLRRLQCSLAYRGAEMERHRDPGNEARQSAERAWKRAQAEALMSCPHARLLRGDLFLYLMKPASTWKEDCCSKDKKHKNAVRSVRFGLLRAALVEATSATADQVMRARRLDSQCAPSSAQAAARWTEECGVAEAAARHVEFEIAAGDVTAALSLLQASVEWLAFPSSEAGMPVSQARSKFEEFWAASVPRLGQPGAPGFGPWLAAQSAPPLAIRGTDLTLQPEQLSESSESEMSQAENGGWTVEAGMDSDGETVPAIDDVEAPKAGILGDKADENVDLGSGAVDRNAERQSESAEAESEGEEGAEEGEWIEDEGSDSVAGFIDEVQRDEQAAQALHDLLDEFEEGREIDKEMLIEAAVRRVMMPACDDPRSASEQDNVGQKLPFEEVKHVLHYGASIDAQRMQIYAMLAALGVPAPCLHGPLLEVALPSIGALSDTLPPLAVPLHAPPLGAVQGLLPGVTSAPGPTPTAGVSCLASAPRCAREPFETFLLAADAPEQAPPWFAQSSRRAQFVRNLLLQLLGAGSTFEGDAALVRALFEVEATPQCVPSDSDAGLLAAARGIRVEAVEAAHARARANAERWLAQPWLQHDMVALAAFAGVEARAGRHKQAIKVTRVAMNAVAVAQGRLRGHRWMLAWQALLLELQAAGFQLTCDCRAFGAHVASAKLQQAALRGLHALLWAAGGGTAQFKALTKAELASSSTPDALHERFGTQVQAARRAFQAAVTAAVQSGERISVTGIWDIEGPAGGTAALPSGAAEACCCAVLCAMAFEVLTSVIGLGSRGGWQRASRLYSHCTNSVCADARHHRTEVYAWACSLLSLAALLPSSELPLGSLRHDALVALALFPFSHFLFHALRSIHAAAGTWSTLRLDISVFASHPTASTRLAVHLAAYACGLTTAIEKRYKTNEERHTRHAQPIEQAVLETASVCEAALQSGAAVAQPLSAIPMLGCGLNKALDRHPPALLLSKSPALWLWWLGREFACSKTVPPGPTPAADAQNMVKLSRVRAGIVLQAVEECPWSRGLRMKGCWMLATAPYISNAEQALTHTLYESIWSSEIALPCTMDMMEMQKEVIELL